MFDLSDLYAARAESRLRYIEVGECWQYIGPLNDRGYGKFRLYGKHYKAHRIAYVVWMGPIPDGMYVCHRCDNPPCIRPSHLWLGTALDNARDRVMKGRGR